MGITIPLLLLCACSALAEPLSAANKRRSDSGIYANRYDREYEPVAYVAVPLHKPMPVLHVLSSNPILQKPKRSILHPTQQARFSQSVTHGGRNYDYSYATSQRHPNYAVSNSQRNYDSPVYASSMTQYWHRKPELPEPPKYEIPPLSANPLILFADPSATNHEPVSIAQDPEPVVLYARPNPQGGFTYRQKPKREPQRERVKVKKDPVIIRIHKYRIVKDDR